MSQKMTVKQKTAAWGLALASLLLSGASFANCRYGGVMFSSLLLAASILELAACAVYFKLVLRSPK